MSKSVPVSVRLSPEDSAYLASLKVEGCYTVSEKIRHLVKAARVSAQAKASVEQDVKHIKTMLDPFDKRLTHIEAMGQGAAFVRYLSEWLPGVMAIFDVAGGQDLSLKDMQEIEAKAFARVLDLIDHLSRQAVTSISQNISPKLMDKGRENLIELLDLLKQQQKTVTK